MTNRTTVPADYTWWKPPSAPGVGEATLVDPIAESVRDEADNEGESSSKAQRR